MMEWVFHISEEAPAFVLSRSGYDVWMLNNRGCRFSLNHTDLDPSSKAFWEDVHWEKMGLFDFPNATDYILKRHDTYDYINVLAHS